MLREYAIDPGCWIGGKSTAGIVQDCGVEHGRLISDFPNRWRKMVWERLPRTRIAQRGSQRLCCTDLEKRLSGQANPLSATLRFQ